MRLKNSEPFQIPAHLPAGAARSSRYLDTCRGSARPSDILVSKQPYLKTPCRDVPQKDLPSMRQLKRGRRGHSNYILSMPVKLRIGRFDVLIQIKFCPRQAKQAGICASHPPVVRPDSTKREKTGIGSTDSCLSIRSPGPLGTKRPCSGESFSQKPRSAERRSLCRWSLRPSRTWQTS